MASTAEKEFIKRTFRVDPFQKKRDTIKVMGIEVSKDEYERMKNNEPLELTDEMKLKEVKKNVFRLEDE